MKKITFLISVMVFTLFANAQSNNEELDLFQAAFGMEKKAIVANFVQPTEAQSDAFWALYDEYEVKRKENGAKRVELLSNYAQQFDSMTDEQAETWTNEVIKLSAATDKLIVTYYKKIKKATSPIVATQFYQIESYILTGIRMEILDGVPFLSK
jgi:hypothetical protein